MELFISFGQEHAHRVNGHTFDKDSIARINCESYKDGREKAFEFFGDKFAFDYSYEEIEKNLHFFPRGILDAN